MGLPRFRETVEVKTDSKPWRNTLKLFVLALVCVSTILLLRRLQLLPRLNGGTRPFVLNDLGVAAVGRDPSIYRTHSLQFPLTNQFCEAGQRLRTIGQWLTFADSFHDTSGPQQDILQGAEAVTAGLVPLLNVTSGTPLQDLRASFTKGSQGVVIFGGGSQDTLRLAGHLITALRVVLSCELPIQIAYAGDTDLSPEDRNLILSLEAAIDVSFLDVLDFFDESKLRLEEDRWAIKPFAALASQFEQVIVVDADAIFLQSPEVLFNQQPFVDHGVYLFRNGIPTRDSDRQRHDRLKDQVERPSSALNDPQNWMEDDDSDYDSGVVAFDKSRVEVIMGLLHTSWQNTYAVRKETKNRLANKAQHSWWLGMELVGAGYAFEPHYGSIIGWEDDCESSNKDKCVCSFVTAHLDDNERLLWFRGGLMKSDLTGSDDHEIPEVWMTGGQWRKSANNGDMSCMGGARVHPLGKRATIIMALTSDAAQEVDTVLGRR